MTTRTTNHHPSEKVSRQDIYTRVTEKIVAELKQGVRPWIKPWNAEHVASKITRPLRHNGTPYSGINSCCSGVHPWIMALLPRSG